MPEISGFPDLPAGLAFTGPTLFIAGDRSDHIRPEHRPAIKRLFPRAQLIRIKDSGHWVHAERPQPGDSRRDRSVEHRLQAHLMDERSAQPAVDGENCGDRTTRRSSFASRAHRRDRYAGAGNFSCGIFRGQKHCRSA